jgi:hypothetical protein
MSRPGRRGSRSGRLGTVGADRIVQPDIGAGRANGRSEALIPQRMAGKVVR